MTHSDYLYSRIAELLADPTGECEIWPHGQNGHGYGRVQSKKLGARGVHVVACTARNGPRPDGMDAAHTCGVKLCFNPDHLSWKTRKENEADKILHGTSQHGERNTQARLSVADIAAIRSSTLLQRELADMYGVRQGTISRIINQKRWAQVPMA